MECTGRLRQLSPGVCMHVHTATGAWILLLIVLVRLMADGLLTDAECLHTDPSLLRQVHKSERLTHQSRQIDTSQFKALHSNVFGQALTRVSRFSALLLLLCALSFFCFCPFCVTSLSPLSAKECADKRDDFGSSFEVSAQQAEARTDGGA